MKEEQKSEFISKMEGIAKQVTELVQESEGRKGLILIATDNDGEETGTIIACAGNGGEIIKGLSEFAMQESTAPMFSEAMKIVTMKKLFKMIGKDRDGNCDECEKEHKTEEKKGE